MRVDRRFLLLAVFVLLSCGIPPEQHDHLTQELAATKKELETATARVRELEGEVARLSNTDGGHWSKVLDYKAKSQWLSVISETDTFLATWPRSQYAEDARQLRTEAVNNQADALLAQARSQLEKGAFEQAKATLVSIQEKYPSSRANAQATADLRGLDAKIAQARRRAVGNGAWRVSTETSPVDDSTNVHLSLTSDDTISGQFGETVQPQLYVRCKERKTEVFVAWDVYLGIGSTDVLHRLDARPARTSEWSISTDYKATFYPGSDVSFARELQNHSRLLLRVTPYGEKPVTATFNLTGLENAIEPLKQACGWT